jgi:hypothetical protein
MQNLTKTVDFKRLFLSFSMKNFSRLTYPANTMKTKPGRIFNHTPENKTMNTVWNRENSHTKIIPAEPGVRVQETDRGKSANAKSHPAQTLQVAGWPVTMKATACRWLRQKRISQWVALIGIATGSIFGIQATVHAAGNLPADNTCVFTLTRYTAKLSMDAEDGNVVLAPLYEEYNAKTRADSLELENAQERYHFSENTGNRNPIEFTVADMNLVIDLGFTDADAPIYKSSYTQLLNPSSKDIVCGTYNASLLFTTSFENQGTGGVFEEEGENFNTIQCPGEGNTINGRNLHDELAIFEQAPLPGVGSAHNDHLIWMAKLGYSWTCTRKPRPLTLDASVAVFGSSIKRIRTGDYETVRPGQTATLSSCDTSISRLDGSSYGTESEGTVTYKIIDKSTEARTLYTFGTSTMKDNDRALFGYCRKKGICDTSSEGNCTSIKGKTWTNTTGAIVYLIADTKKTQGADSTVKLNAKFSIK